MGESIAEATILKWLKKEGDEVKKDETILEISTDKVDSEIPAPESGVLVEILADEGDTVEVKSKIAVIETDKAAAENGSKTKKKDDKKEKEVAQKKQAKEKEEEEDKKEEEEKEKEQEKKQAKDTQKKDSAASKKKKDDDGEEESKAASSGTPSHYGDKFYSPLVRSVAAQHGISPTELAGIPGSGEQGRVTKNDVMEYLKHRESHQRAGSFAPAARSAREIPAPPQMKYGEDGTRVEEMDNMRKRIAEHMVRSKATSPHVYSTAEIDVTNVVKCREKNKRAFQAREGFKLSFTPFFLDAAVKGLRQFPYINASIDGESIILKKDINLGCAVALGNTGLIVPVIKKADQYNLVGLASQLNDLAQRARSKKLQPDEIMGGTFTVTNPGVFGNIIGNPIINQPQVAILSLGAIKKRPIVKDDMIGIGDIIYLTLSYDHRLVDGSLAGQYLKFVSDYLEGWNPNEEIV